MEWGCNTDAVLPLMLDGETILRCPRRPYLDNSAWYNHVLSSYKYAQKGMLTEPGTWLDQGAKLISAFAVLDAATEDAKEKNSGSSPSSAAKGGAQKQGGPPRGARGGNMSPIPGRS